MFTFSFEWWVWPKYQIAKCQIVVFSIIVSIIVQKLKFCKIEIEYTHITLLSAWDGSRDSTAKRTLSKRRAHKSSPHGWHCHFWDWHNWYLTLLIKFKLILVNAGTLNYWYWEQFTLALLKLDISDLQNDWHLQVLIFGIIGISCFWFLELFIFSMCDMKHDWYMTWLTLSYLILGIFGIEHYQKLGVIVIICHWYMMP
jgi:hypothetical protein